MGDDTKVPHTREGTIQPNPPFPPPSQPPVLAFPPPLRRIREGHSGFGKSRRKGLSKDSGLQSSSRDVTRRSRRGIGKELKEGLDRAYFGPDVREEVKRGTEFPWSFELERRNLYKLPITGSKYQGRYSESLVNTDTSFSNVVEMVVGRKLLGRVTSKITECEEEERLLFHYGDNTTEGRRRRVPDDIGGGYTYKVDVIRDGDVVATVEDDGGVKTGLFGNVTGRMKVRKRRVTVVRSGGKEGTERETHRIVWHRTPGVETGVIFKSNEDRTKGKMEGKIVRCELPPSTMWAWEPRRESHDVGGFHIEKTDQYKGFDDGDGDYMQPMENWVGGISPEVRKKKGGGTMYYRYAEEFPTLSLAI